MEMQLWVDLGNDQTGPQKLHLLQKLQWLLGWWGGRLHQLHRPAKLQITVAMYHSPTEGTLSAGKVRGTCHGR